MLRELRPQLDDDRVELVATEGAHQGLRFTAAFDGDTCVGVAGWRLMCCTSAGRKLYVDDLVTSTATRSTGVGSALLDGRPGPYRDTVLLNAAAALIVAGRASTLPDGVAQAAACLDQGAALGALDALRRATG